MTPTIPFGPLTAAYYPLPPKEDETRYRYANAVGEDDNPMPEHLAPKYGDDAPMLGRDPLQVRVGTYSLIAHPGGLTTPAPSHTNTPRTLSTDNEASDWTTASPWQDQSQWDSATVRPGLQQRGVHLRASRAVHDYKDDSDWQLAPGEYIISRSAHVQLPPLVEDRQPNDGHWGRPRIPASFMRSAVIAPTRTIAGLDSPAYTVEEMATHVERAWVAPAPVMPAAAAILTPPGYEVDPEVYPEDEGPYPGASLAPPRYNFVPKGPMDPPFAPDIIDSACGIAEASAIALYDHYNLRFGAIGAPVEDDPRMRPPTGEPLDPEKAYCTRREFIAFVDKVINATLVLPGTVLAAMSYLLDRRMRKELAVRRLTYSYTAALAIANKVRALCSASLASLIPIAQLLSDNPYSTRLWAKAASLDFDQLREAEYAVLYALNYDVQPKVDPLVDVTRNLMDRSPYDHNGRALLIPLLDAMLL
jgi:hypothetical protein